VFEGVIITDDASNTELYFSQMLLFYPFILSLGLGGSIMAAFYYIMNKIYTRIKDIFVCSVSLNMYDETFKWVIKYIQDKKLIKADNVLKA
jgi:hypothetical protein